MTALLLGLACRAPTPIPTDPVGPAPTGHTAAPAPTGDTGTMPVAEPWSPTDGLTLWAPLLGRETWLLDGAGRTVHAWSHAELPGVAAELRPDGTLIRAARLPEPDTFADNEGGVGGAIEVIGPDGAVRWRWELATDAALLHHDFAVLPSGNLLLLSFDPRTEAEVESLGADPGRVGPRGAWGERVLEVCRSAGCTDGEIVWSWSVWDHVAQDRDPAAPLYVPDLADRPDRLDVDDLADPAFPDWLHVNAIDVDPGGTRILLSVRERSEVWLLDRTTGTLQLRFGAGVFDGQHDAHWIPPGLPGAGHVLLFDNGRDRGWSAAREWCLPPDCPAPVEVWSTAEGPGGDLFSVGLSSAQRWADGRTVLTLGTLGEVREIAPDGTEVWRGEPSVGGLRAVFRGPRYPEDFPGLPPRAAR